MIARILAQILSRCSKQADVYILTVIARDVCTSQLTVYVTEVSQLQAHVQVASTL